MPSITRRLTSWYAGILFAILLLNGVAVYYGMRYLLFKEAKRDIKSTISIIQRMAESDAKEDEMVEGREIISSVGGNAFWVQVTTPQGKVLYHSSNVGKRAFAPNYVGPPIVKKNHGEDIIFGGAKIRQGILVQVGRPFEKEEDFLDNLASILVTLAFLSLVFTIAGGRVITKTALRPIKKLTRTAQSISTTDFSQRIELSGPQDELYRLAETFNQMLDRLEKGYRSQQEFLVAASHDLRTPLSVIKSYTDVLNRWGKGEPAVLDESLLAIDRAVHVMERLVNDLLVLIRVQATPELKLVPLELGNLAEEIVQEAQSISGEIQIILDKLDSAPILADEHYIRRAIWALVDNAIKYNKPFGKVVVGVDCRNAEEEAILSVQDTGSGIDEKDFPKLFNRFYRGDPSRNETKGFGLGLTLAKEIVEAHGGRITVESQAGKGSRFEVVLPLSTKN